MELPNLLTTSPEVREMTPQRMFRAANVMNAAYARYMARLLQDRTLFSPYRRTDFSDEGRVLADEIWETEDQGYYSDIEVTDRWAKRLNLQDWYEWRQVGEVQEMQMI